MADLDIVVTATDKASGELRQINRQLGGMEQTAKRGGRMGGFLSGALGLAGGVAVAGIAALGAGLTKSVMAAADAQEAMSKFNVVFANTGDQVTEQLGNFAEAAGRNRFELLEYAAVLGDTLKPMGFAEEAAAGLSSDLVELATDLSSFNNMPMDEALRRLQGTLIGSHENALAFGVIINENTLKAEIAAMGLGDLTGAALEQAKVQARINLLTKGTTDAQGDAIRTAGSWTNQMRALTSRLAEAAVEIGNELLPVLTPLLEALVDFAVDVTPKVVEWTKRAIAVFREWWQFIDTKLMPVILPLVRVIGEVWVAAFNVFVAALNQTVLPALQALWRFIDTYIVSVFGSWANAVDALVGKIEIAVGWLRSLQGLLSSINLSNINIPNPFDRGQSRAVGAGAGASNFNMNMTFNGQTEPAAVQRAVTTSGMDLLNLQRRRGR